MKDTSFPEILNDDVITLKRHHHQFDNRLFEAIDQNRSHLRPWLFWVDATKTVEDSQKTTDLFIDLWQKGRNFAYVILDKEDNILGTIDFHDVNLENRCGEIGYWLRQDKTGCGYISRAIKLLEKEIFDRDFIRIYITCDSINNASAATAVRNGYEYEGCCRKALKAYEEFHDRLIYAKINPKTD